MFEFLNPNSELMSKVDAFMQAHPNQPPDGKANLTFTGEQKAQIFSLSQSIMESNPQHIGLLQHFESGLADIEDAATGVLEIPLMILLMAAMLLPGGKPAFT